jgi:selenocysteine lyase/cysteine desulfurase
MNTTLDLAFARSNFPAFSTPTLAGQAFLENAGGSYPCRQVVDRLHEFYTRLKVQPYFCFAPSAEGGEWMDHSRTRMAEYLGVAREEVNFGPSTSQNTYVLANAFRGILQPADEVIVTNQDHEANTGAWRRLARAGVTVKEWRVDADTGRLDPRQLERLFSPRTKLLAFTHASNVVAHINPVARITALARAAGIATVVDGVSWAPHGMPDVAALGADAYLFSSYKTYGPHQGVMVVRRALLERLPNEGHYFNEGIPTARLTPAGPDHAQQASMRGVLEYFDALDAHHFAGQPASGRPHRVRELLRLAELALLEPLLEALAARRDIRLLGPSDPHERAPTVAFLPLKVDPETVARRLAAKGYMVGNGNFYAVRLLEAMGVNPDSGVVRVSLLHYNSPSEITGLLAALDEALRPA